MGSQLIKPNVERRAESITRLEKNIVTSIEAIHNKQTKKHKNIGTTSAANRQCRTKREKLNKLAKTTIIPLYNLEPIYDVLQRHVLYPVNSSACILQDRTASDESDHNNVYYTLFAYSNKEGSHL
ncbi:hypothetical protein C0J52_28082 [Blattella germanica]|nr:hypothetical protein C0J52_28082 [Blattella germanica]